MNSNGYYENWPQNQAHTSFQSNTQQPYSESWNRSNSGSTNTTPNLVSGYVHSGYQAAIQASALQSAQASQPQFPGHPGRLMQNAVIHTRSSTIRPPRLGPGGPVQCSYPGCEYSGYAKAVEIHNMDRHLIFPPGYKAPKSIPDGDIGPNVTIPGTGISLNTPDAIEAWIAERKKNWPTDARIAQKKKRKAEAVERGELECGPNKRARIEGSQPAGDGNGRYSRGRGRRHDGRGSLRSRGDGRGHALQVAQAEQPVERLAMRLPDKPSVVTVLDTEEETSSDSGSGSDVDPVRDIVSSKIQPMEQDETAKNVDDEELVTQPKDTSIKALKKRPPKQPAPKPCNPLVDRPSFLRKLLQPEIRHTVSNLSQAVRFIVDNDMFKGVELNPGDAENVLIKELRPAEPAD